MITLDFRDIRGMRYTSSSVVPMNMMFIQQAVYHKVINIIIPTIEPLYAMIETAITSRQLKVNSRSLDVNNNYTYKWFWTTKIKSA